MATILSLNITGSTASYVIVDLTVQLNNPSDTTITVGDINFDVLMPAYNNARVGVVYMAGVIIPPGAKTYVATMHLGEMATSAEAVGAMFTNYMTGVTVPLVIAGTERSTNIVPLSLALSSLQLASAAPGTQTKLITEVYVTGELDELTQGIAKTKITLNNPLDTSITIIKINAVSKKNIVCTAWSKTFVGYQTIGTIDYILPQPLTIPARATVQTDFIPLTLPGIVEGMQSILGDRHIDVDQHAEVIVGDGFHITDMYYFQKNVDFLPYIPPFSDISGFYNICMTDTIGIMSTSISATSNNASSISSTISTILPTSTPNDVSSTTISVPVSTTDASTTTTDVPVTTTSIQVTTTSIPATTTDAPAPTETEAPTSTETLTQTETAAAPTSTL